MNEIFEKLLKSELLTEETKTELQQAVTELVEQAKTEARAAAELEVRSELVAKWGEQRDSLIDAIDEQVNTLVAEELKELHDDVERFRDLEVEKAAEIVEEKKALAAQLREELSTLVDKLDAFFEERITAEIAELREDIADAKTKEFGREIFEAFQGTFNKHFVDEASVQSKLRIAEDQLKAAKAKLSEIEEEKMVAVREAKMAEVLAPLTGDKREQMALILKNTPTEKLQEGYNTFIGKILKETTPAPVVEAAPAPAPVVESKPVAKPANRVVTGDKPKPAPKADAEPIVEAEDPQVARMRQLAFGR